MSKETQAVIDENVAGATQTPEKPVAEKVEATLLGGEEGEVVGSEKDGSGKETEGEAKDGEAKPDGELPEKYEVKVEGFEIDNALIDTLSPVFKKYGLKNEAVQELAQAYAPIVAKQFAAQREAALGAWKAEIETWKNESIKMLGANADVEMALAARFIDKFGGPKLRELLNDTGLGNHPEVVKAFIKAGKAISEDVFVDPDIKTRSGEKDWYTHPTSQGLK